MGGIHNELRRGPWTKAATGILGDTREGSGVERLGESMTPILDLWSSARPDWALYRNEKLVFLHGFQAAVAGELSCIVFEAPAAPNNILIIDEIHVVGTGQHLVGYDARPAGAVEVTTKDFLDQRARPIAAARPRSRVFTDTNVASAVTGPFFRFTGATAGNNILKGPFILLGNNLALIVEHQTANSSDVVTAFGREREMLPSEEQ